MNKTLVKRLIAVVMLLLVSGCVMYQPQPLTWKAMSGSKSDGTLKLAYLETSMSVFAQPPNPAQGQAIADARCRSWGYTKAVAFDFINKKCQSQSYSRTIRGGDDDSDRLYESSCDEYLITQDYQCEK